MNNIYQALKIILSVILIAVSYNCKAQPEVGDKNLSPYFLVLSAEGEQEQMPLKSTVVDAEISGVIADVHVTQEYVNEGKSTIEAIYVFPASTRAAVYNMVMHVNDRTIKAVIEEKGKARQKYQQAKKQGKTASLLEEETPNVFKMKVANIVPGARVQVHLYYTELLVPTEQTYEFVYPTVVGPRYVSQNEIKQNTAKDWVANPYLKEGEKPTSTLDIHVNLTCGMPIKQMSCSTHKTQINYTDKTQAQLKLDEKQGGNRDFIMRYNLAGNQIETGVLLYEDPNGENFFLAMMQPPKRVAEAKIPVREYVFIVDVSGSMSGFPLDISKKVMHDVLTNLKPTDLFNIVFFAGGSEVYSKESQQATPENIKKAINYMNSTSGSGGTDLLQALKTAMSLNNTEGFSRSFVIMTDGYVSVEKETFDYIRNNLNQANFFSFGIGTGVNRYIIEGMAHVGYGEAFIAESQQAAGAVALRFVNYISTPSLTNISYQFKGLEAYDVVPEYIPDLFANRPLIISGKYKGTAQGSLLVTGISGGEKTGEVIKISSANKTKGNALKYLWAREKIRLLADYNNLRHDADTRNEIIALSLKYNLLTEFTSFLAIDDKVVNPGGNQQSVKQPLPLPIGVSNMAVSGELIIVEDDMEINEELVVYDSELAEDSEIEFDIVLEEEEVDDHIPVFFEVEDMPEFPGGQQAMMSYIGQNLRYPVKAQECGIQGTIYITFSVDVDGSITDVKVARGVDPMLDAEAIRIVKSMPKWKPGSQRGKKVKVSYTVPIRFVLS